MLTISLFPQGWFSLCRLIMLFTRQHVGNKSHHVVLLRHLPLLRQLPPVFLRDGFLTKVNLPKWNFFFSMHYHTCIESVQLQNTKRHIMLILPTIWCGFRGPASSFPGSFSWAQPPSSSCPAACCCCCCHRKCLTERQNIHRLETESAGGSIPLWACLYLPPRLWWWGYWGLLSTTLPPQQGWRHPSAASV